MRYANPNTEGSKVTFKEKYDNFIGGKWVAPVSGEYFDDISPVDGKAFAKVAKSGAEDVELALDAAHAAKDDWNRSSPTDRANLLLKIADRLEENLELLAVAETWENGKPIRETPSIISVILQAVSAPKKGASARLTKIQWRIISMSRSVSSGRLSRGIFRS